MGRSLVLNASNEPLGIVGVRRAVVLVLKRKAEVLANNGMVFHAERTELRAPSVIRLHNYVRVPRRVHVTPSRRAVFMRDGFVCQYCGHAAENIDHVQPRSKGGKHTWDNVVAACRRCNTRKENRTPREANLVLARKPAVPPDGFWLQVLIGQAEPEWVPFLPAPVTSRRAAAAT